MKSISLILLTISSFLFTVPALARVTYSTVNLNDAQKAKVVDAIRIVNSRVWKAAVVRCVIDNSRKTMWAGDRTPHVYPNRREAEQGIGMLLLGIQSYGLKEGDLNYKITIYGTSMDQNINGSAQLSITKPLDEEDDGRSKYVITLNTATIGQRTAAGIAGTIFHEMLHNIGFSHPSTGNYDVDYKSHIIKEYGLCIAGDGVQGFGLTADRFMYGIE